MTKFFLILTLVLVVILAILILIICVQSHLHKKQLQNLEAENQEKQNQENKRVNEVLNNAQNEKNNLHGDDVTSFNNSLNILQKYANKHANKSNTN